MPKLPAIPIFVACLGGLCALLIAFAADADAHDKLVGSSPADGAAVRQLPASITLFFEEPPAAGFTQVSVTGPNGASVNAAGPTIHGSRITEAIRAVSRPGPYSITYRILSDDGHPVSGMITFTVGPTASTGQPAARASVSSWTTALALGAAALVIGSVFVAARNARS